MSSPISGFTAIPNPQMLAFMPIQSYLMMYFAGSAWQFGKRKISAKSNEEFNKLTMKTLLEEHTIELKSVIPTLEKSMDDVTPLIRILIEQYGDFVREAIRALPEAIGNIFQGTSGSVQQSQFGITQVRGYVPGDSRNYGTTGQKELDAQIRALINKYYTPGSQTQLGPGYQGKKNSSSITLRTSTREQQVRSFGSTLIKPQLSLGEKARISGQKRKAGQSQNIERGKLTKLISALGTEAKYWLRRNPNGPQFKDRSSRLKIAQQRLVTLLARYRF